MPHSVLNCGCSAAGPCPLGASLFERGHRCRQYLYRHIEAGMRGNGLRRLHTWQYQRDGGVLRRCAGCGLEVASDKRWRARDGEWLPGPMQECTGQAALGAAVVRVKAANRKLRVA